MPKDIVLIHLPQEWQNMQMFPMQTRPKLGINVPAFLYQCPCTILRCLGLLGEVGVLLNEPSLPRFKFAQPADIAINFLLGDARQFVTRGNAHPNTRWATRAPRGTSLIARARRGTTGLWLPALSWPGSRRALATAPRRSKAIAARRGAWRSRPPASGVPKSFWETNW